MSEQINTMLLEQILSKIESAEKFIDEAKTLITQDALNNINVVYDSYYQDFRTHVLQYKEGTFSPRDFDKEVLIGEKVWHLLEINPYAYKTPCTVYYYDDKGYLKANRKLSEQETLDGMKAFREKFIRDRDIQESLPLEEEED